jgi:hypothetical protein
MRRPPSAAYEGSGAARQAHGPGSHCSICTAAATCSVRHTRIGTSSARSLRVQALRRSLPSTDSLRSTPSLLQSRRESGLPRHRRTRGPTDRHHRRLRGRWPGAGPPRGCSRRRCERTARLPSPGDAHGPAADSAPRRHARGPAGRHSSLRRACPGGGRRCNRSRLGRHDACISVERGKPRCG